MLPRWWHLLLVLAVAAFLLLELAMANAFSPEAVRERIKTEFGATKACLMEPLAAQRDAGGEYGRVLAGYLIKGINTSELYVRSVERAGYAYEVRAQVRYPDLPLEDGNLSIYVAMWGERRVQGGLSDVAGSFGTRCASVCGGMVLGNRSECSDACARIQRTLDENTCLPKG